MPRFGKTILFLWLLSLAAACSPQAENQVPYYSSPDFTPKWDMPDHLHTVPLFRFVNQYGDTVTRDTFSKRVYLANFFFTSCPGICPRMTRTMKQVYELFRDQPGVMFLSHSVTPERDSISVLYEYARKNGIPAGRWHLVTGTKSSIYEIARKGYFIEEEMGFSRDSTEFLHTENLVLVDGKGHLRGIYNGTLPAEVPRIQKDIEILLQESGSQ